MRSFIAIELPHEVKQQMAEVQRRLKSNAVDASWPKPEGIHLTLKFLGEIPDAQAAEVAVALERAVRGTGGFRVEVRGIGAFPNVRNPRVVWIGVSGEIEKLNRLQAAVEDAMAALGIERENRSFSPHLTLARIKYIRSRDAWVKALEQVKDVVLPGFDADAVSLMKSELKRTGAEYTQIAKVLLK